MSDQSNGTTPSEPPPVDAVKETEEKNPPPEDKEEKEIPIEQSSSIRPPTGKEF